jgi:AcrR family transcriptional regulator
MSRMAAKAKHIPPATCAPEDQGDLRSRILGAAFDAFMEHGFARASTLEIASRARVSKRELYALFASKQAMLEACITGRSRVRLPLDLPEPRDRAMFEAVLVGFGATLMREVCKPEVIGTFRLAIAESELSPEVARVLDQFGRQATRAALARHLAAAQAAGLLGAGDPAEMAAEFLALLWRDLLVSLLLRVRQPPAETERLDHARRATAALLALYPAG